jgi:hypothetical protein
VRGDRHDDDPELDAPAEELVAETTAYSVCGSSGIDRGEFSIAYLAGGANTRRSPPRLRGAASGVSEAAVRAA